MNFYFEGPEEVPELFEGWNIECLAPPKKACQKCRGITRLLLKKGKEMTSNTSIDVRKWHAARYKQTARARADSCYRRGLAAKFRNRNYAARLFIQFSGKALQSSPRLQSGALNSAMQHAVNGIFLHDCLRRQWHLNLPFREPHAKFPKCTFPHITGAYLGKLICQILQEAQA